MVVLETERLRMRPWREDDFENFAAYHADERHARFIGGRCDRDEAWRRLAAIVGHWHLRGYGFWAVEEREGGAFVGCVGLWRPEGWPELEVGYWLVEAMQGRGFAAEAILRARDYAYDVLGERTLVSYIDAENAASIRVAERVGAHYEETIELGRHGPHRVYRHPQA